MILYRKKLERKPHAAIAVMEMIILELQVLNVQIILRFCKTFSYLIIIFNQKFIKIRKLLKNLH